MDNITIPPEALEAAEEIIADQFPALHLTKDEYTAVIRAACLAMLRAWPGMMEHKIQVPDNSDEVLCVLKTVVGLMLPLTETDDEPR